MTVKVLVVDDSSFFRRRVSEIINAGIGLEVVGTANNGREAVDKVKSLSPDVVTMDIEMPVMDGISAVKEIMKSRPTPVLMFSSLTHDGARATLEALDAGAMDFLPKRFEDIAKDKKEAARVLQQRVQTLGRRRPSPIPRGPASSTAASARPGLRSTSGRPAPTATANRTGSLRPAVGAGRSPVSAPQSAPAKRATKSGKQYKLVAIGTSTGGPVALQTILCKIPANFPHPIVLIQHMPGTFTGAFAQRLDGLCKIKVKEAEDGDVLRPGHAYLAPGGKQMMIDGKPTAARLRIVDGGEKVNYKPSVDITFGSAAKIFKDSVLAVVLTGMGADGRDGARLLKTVGSRIWAQDEQSCVVYGMPQAVASAGIAEESIALADMAERITTEAGNG